MHQLQQAVQAIKAGDKATGQRLLAQVVKVERDNSTAWLWLSATMTDPIQKQKCLEEVLRINSAHPQATAALKKIRPPKTPAPAIKTAPLRNRELSRTPTTPLRKLPPTPPGDLIPAPQPTSSTLPNTSEETLYELPEWLTQYTPPAAAKPEHPPKASSADTEEAPYTLPEWMVPTEAFPISRSASSSPTTAFVTDPEEDANKLPDWLSSLKSLAAPDIAPSSNVFSADSEEMSYELPDWLSRPESPAEPNPRAASSIAFTDPEEDANKLPDWLLPSEPTQPSSPIFDDEPASEPPAAPPSRVPVNDDERVEIPAWMERMYNPSQKGSVPIRVFEPSAERSFWETPLSESNQAAWQTAETPPFAELEDSAAPAQEYPAWDVPWHEATQAQEQSRREQQPKDRPSARKGYAWYDHWFTVVGIQNVEAFNFVLSDPNLSIRRVVSWMCVAYFFQVLAGYGLGIALRSPQGADSFMLLISAILAAVFASLLVIPFFLLQVGIQQLGARIVGGRGTYRQFAFTLAAYQAPMLMMNALLTLSTFILEFNALISLPVLIVLGGVMLGVIIISIRLNLNAYRATHQLGIARTLAAMMAPGVIVISLAGCLAFFLMQR